MSLTIPQERLEKYFALAKEALKAARIVKGASKEHGQKILDLAKQYITDAEHFHKQDDDVRAFAALNYAHGWLDCGAALGLIEGPGSDLERWT